MKCDIPVLLRCCFCFPLRAGLLAWTYFRMLAFLFFIFFLIDFIDTLRYDQSPLAVMVFVAIALLIFEIIICFIFLVAAHKKSFKLMQKCLYINMFSFLVNNSSIFIMTIIYILHTGLISERMVLIGIIISILNCVIKFYLIILTRSEIIKLKVNASTTGANDVENSYCDMKANHNCNNVMKDLQIMKQHARVLEEPVYCYAYGMKSGTCSEHPVCASNPLPIAKATYEYM